MICQNCGENEANIRYTEIVNGVKREMALCDKCSKELDLQTLDFNIPINFSSFLGEFLEDNDNVLPSFMKEDELKCNYCGMTFEDFVNNGKLGCANCYNIFENKINNILKNLHGSNIHLGRKYLIEKDNTLKFKNEKEKIEVKNELSKLTKVQKLKEELKKAIKDERYEDAAKFRDEIKKIEE